MGVVKCVKMCGKSCDKIETLSDWNKQDGIHCKGPTPPPPTEFSVPKRNKNLSFSRPGRNKNLSFSRPGRNKNLSFFRLGRNKNLSFFRPGRNKFRGLKKEKKEKEKEEKMSIC